MNILRTKNYEEMSYRAAGIVSAQILLKPDCVLGLATGSSPVGLYKHLIAQYEKGELEGCRQALKETCGLYEQDRIAVMPVEYFLAESWLVELNDNTDPSLPVS